MITLLSRLFIADYGNYDNADVRRKYGMMSGAVGIFLNVVLFAFKYFAGVVSGSVAVAADAFNNLSDAASSTATLIGFKFMGMKPDGEHPFGHGRVEYVSGFIVSLIILLMGIELLFSSIEKIVDPADVYVDAASFLILACSILVKIYMAAYNRSLGKKIKSTAMKAAAVDSFSDAIATSAVILSMIVIKITGVNIDGYAGAAVAVFILYAGYGAAKDAISPLLGTKPDRELVDAIEEIILSHKGILGVHDLVVHDYGPGRMMISLHAEVPGNRSIFEVHDMIDHIENDLNERFSCETVIHMDPVDVDDDRMKQLRRGVEEVVSEYNGEMSIHDFRIASCRDCTKLMFDMLVPPECYENADAVRDEVAARVQEKFPGCRAIIKIDKSYI